MNNPESSNTQSINAPTAPTANNDYFTNLSSYNSASQSGNDNSNIAGAKYDYSELDNHVNDLESKYNLAKSETDRITKSITMLNNSKNNIDTVSKFLPGRFTPGFHYIQKKTINNGYNKIDNEIDKLNLQLTQAAQRRDDYFKLLQEAKNQKVANATNIKNNINRYTYEKEALKEAGIKNPYFMLRGGPLPNFAPVSLGANTGSTPKGDEQGKKLKLDKEQKHVIELLRLLLGSRGLSENTRGRVAAKLFKLVK